MEILKAIIVKNHHLMDLVLLETDLPSPVPHVTDQWNVLRFEAEAGKGIEYVQTNFPDIEIEVIERS